ncbi:MAG: AmmeMemoRadiSam system radical SAM enzyme [Candidatus Omnitrophica bacterium]|nr:AmmeMemoRadiSam system radical SAM enzyme [Candidatus Omnitrophota bacterium]
MRRKAVLWEKTGQGKIHCFLCAHNCQIGEDDYGFCGMRQNIGGELFTYAYGSVIANHVDPIEKKPLYHFLPGTYAYSIATIGCNFRCTFCQNWTISQMSKKDGDLEGLEMKPEQVVKEALDNDCKSISYTYTEPTIFFEYALDTAKLAKKKGLHNNFVTNGYMTKQAVETIKPYLDAANVDLKFFNDDIYRRMCSARLQPVLDTIKNLYEAGIWVEVTTLVVPGQNDSEEELRNIARFISDTSRDIPWHISRFHPDYKYSESPATPLETMEEAKKIGEEEGLNYIYLGNVHTRAETVCPQCGASLIDRAGFTAKISEDFTSSASCRKCGTKIAGVWK